MCFIIFNVTLVNYTLEYYYSSFPPFVRHKKENQRNAFGSWEHNNIYARNAKKIKTHARQYILLDFIASTDFILLLIFLRYFSNGIILYYVHHT